MSHQQQQQQQGKAGRRSEKASQPGQSAQRSVRKPSRVASDVTVAQVCGLLEDLINTDSAQMSTNTHSKLKQICALLRQASAPSAAVTDVMLPAVAVNTMAAHDPTVVNKQDEGGASRKMPSDSNSRRFSTTVWSTITTATGMPAVEEQNFYSPSQKRRQMMHMAASSLAYSGSLNRRPQQSMFRRRLSHGHFNQDVSETQLSQLIRKPVTGLPTSPPPRVGGSLADGNGGLLSISAPSPGSDDLALARQASDPCLSGGLRLEDPNDISLEQLSALAETARKAVARRTPETVGIPVHYLPSVLAEDMDYDGKGLVAVGYKADEPLAEGETARPAYVPINGEVVFSELVVPDYPEEAPLLMELDIWDYQIFMLACETGGRVLSMLACQLFDEHNLFSELGIPRGKFEAYFQALERGYRDNPYHNRIHAADVLQSLAYLLNTKIFGFKVACQEDDGATASADGLMENFSRDRLAGMLGEQGDCGDGKGGNGWNCMRDVLSPLELAAAFIAAAQHDYDHPARTNGFLVNSGADLAILYNDRSVLEQYHASSSWKLLIDKHEHNFLEDMSASNVRTLRFMVLDMILATDLAKHVDIINDFRATTQEKSTADFLEKSENRRSVLLMCIKIADINGPAKTGHLHRKWAHLICEEFYEQGLAEASLNLPISPYMDREKPLLPKLQASFIRGLLRPLLVEYALAGFMPGPYELLDEDDVRKSSSQRQDDSNGDDKCQSCLGRVHNHLVSVIMKNASVNEAFWNEIVRKEEEEEEAQKRQEELSKVEEGSEAARQGSPDKAA